MKRFFFTIGIIFLCLTGTISCATYLNTQTENFGSADLFGMVYDNHSQTCPGVRIFIDGTGGPISDVNGRFTIANVSRGTHTIIAKKENFEEASFSIDYLNRAQIVYVKVFSLTQILELAENALTERKLQEAAGYLARAEKIRADDPLLLYLKAVVELKSGRPNEALALFLTLTAKPPVEPHVYLAIADIHEHELRDIPSAIQFLKKFAAAVESEEITARIKRLENAK